jgi:acetate---CoA ligase (ADP-forming)
MRRPNLDRLLRPSTVAIVGANEKIPQTGNAFNFMQESDVEVFLVNPSRSTLYGRPVYPNLASVGKPVDAILSLVNAERTIGLIDEAVAANAGGIVAHAGGFAEIGQSGRELEARLVSVAKDRIAVLGPNCNGYIDFQRGVKISGSPNFPIRTGSIALVTHSGALMSSVAVSGTDRAIGFNYLISTGNEAVVDITDCLEFLIDDPNVRAICLVIEVLRRPEAFLAALRRAVQANKPVVALKLGRGERARAIVNSHTGSIAGESWVYEAALRQYGVGLARDIAELVDRVVYFDQLSPDKWSAVRGLAVVTPSGGGASLLSDSFGEHGLSLPSFEGSAEPIKNILPTAKVFNPLDMTGFIITHPEVAEKLFDFYANEQDVDTLLMQWFVDDSVMTIGAPFLKTFGELAAKTKKTILFGSFDDGRFGEWASGLPAKGIGVTRGLLSTARALQSMSNFVRFRQRQVARRDTKREAIANLPRPQQWIDSSVGPMLNFETSMQLMSDSGLQVAPHFLVGAERTFEGLPATFLRQCVGGLCVAKLADVPHRTEIGAVRLGVDAAQALDVLQDLRSVAGRLGLPQTVVFQPQLKSDGEAFIGINSDGALGPMVVFGVGGIFIEILKQVVGLVVPFDREDIAERLGELDNTGVFKGIRGAPAWDADQLIEAILAAQRIAISGRDWLGTFDMNPLIFTGGQFLAVDALCTLKPE